jgi:tetratricopeptide (TPR) repeat protein
MTQAPQPRPGARRTLRRTSRRATRPVVVLAARLSVLLAAPLAVALAALMAATGAQAQLFKDPALQAMYAADQTSELAQAGAQRLARQSDDAQAVLAVAMAALGTDDAGRREAAIQRAEACVQKAPPAPQLAVCQYALGTVLGVHAMSQGMLAAGRSAGKVKDALTEAVRLDAQWYPARSAAVEFYLLAPGVMGGSNRRAEELARGAARPEQVRALQARVALQEEQIDKALGLLAQVQPGADSALAEDVWKWQAEAGFALLQANQVAQARPVFERLLRDQPTQAAGAYGLGRTLLEAGEAAQAVALLEKAQRLSGASNYPGLTYRLGMALQAGGQPEAAKAALQRFVAAGRGPGKALDDARKRLAQLGA